MPNNLGVVLKTLGERESGTHLEEAVTAYQAALKVLASETASHWETASQWYDFV